MAHAIAPQRITIFRSMRHLPLTGNAGGYAAFPARGPRKDDGRDSRSDVMSSADAGEQHADEQDRSADHGRILSLFDIGGVRDTRNVLNQSSHGEPQAGGNGDPVPPSPSIHFGFERVFLRPARMTA